MGLKRNGVINENVATKRKKNCFFVLKNLPMGSRKFTFSQKLSLHCPVKKNKNKSLSLSAGVGPTV